MISYQVIVVTPFQQNCRLFVNPQTRECVVSDPGDRGEDIYNAIKVAGFSLKSILITHMHLDLVGGVGKLHELSKAPIYGSAIEDSEMHLHLDRQATAFGLKKAPIFDTHYVKDGEIVHAMDGFDLKVITTPGHTPGGVCYYCETEKLLLTGDTLFNGSVGRTDFPGGSSEDLVDSIKNKLFELPENTQVLCGHGPDTTIGEEKENNPYVF